MSLLSRFGLHIRRGALLLLVAGLGLGPRTASAQGNVSTPWPSVDEQLQADGIRPGTALAQLVRQNQQVRLLDRAERSDQLDLPLWLRVMWRRHHPEMVYLPQDPTGGYPWVLKEVHEWMLSHPDLRPASPEPDQPPSPAQTQGIGSDFRISGSQPAPRSESDIRVNFWDPERLVCSSNNIVGSGHLGQYYSLDRGVTWGQTTLPIQAGNNFQSDPAVDWTSDGVAWSIAIEIDGSSNLRLMAYKSSDQGAHWAFDAKISGTQTSADKELMWVDHSESSPFKNTIYVTWHGGAVEYVCHRSPGGTWSAPLAVSAGETTANALGGDVHTNAQGDVFVFWHSNGNNRIVMAKSTNGGVSFGTPVVIATTSEPIAVHVPAMNAIPTRGTLVYVSGAAFDTHDASPVHMVYAAWTDLSGDAGCTSGANDPGSSVGSTCKSRIWFSRSLDGGATWSAAAKLNNPAGLNDQFHPRLTVDEFTGEVGLVYYDTINDAGRLRTDIWFQSSTDDCDNWSAPAKVTTLQSDETSAGANGNQYGDYIGLSAYRGRFFACWTDRRASGLEEIWGALIRTQPIVHLGFDNASNVGLDDSGNGHDGVLAAATSVAGQCGLALNFLPDNNVQEFTIPHSPDLDVLRQMTGIAWVRVLGTQSPDGNLSCTEGTIFAKEGVNWFQIEKNNNALVFQNEGSGAVGTVASEPVTLTVGQWTQVAYVRDKDGQTVQFYLNGLPVGGTHFIGSTTHTNTVAMMVGNYGFKNDPGACEFNGDIDEIKIYGVALPAASIKHEFDDVAICNLNFIAPGPGSGPPDPCATDPNCPEPILRGPRGRSVGPGANNASPAAPQNESAIIRSAPAFTREGTTFQLAHPVVGDGHVTIFDIAGRTVANIPLQPGTSQARWDGRDAAGMRAAPGIYLVRLHTQSQYGWTRVAIVH